MLAPCDHELGVAALALDPAYRYISAHLAAVRAASAYVDFIGAKTKRDKRSVWEQLSGLGGEWVPWAAFFSAGTRMRRAVEMGVPVAVATADEMTAYAEDFRDEVAMAIDPIAGWSNEPQVAAQVSSSAGSYLVAA
jgi:hypothetical protein